MTVDSTPDLAALDSDWRGEEEGEPALDDLDAGWDLEEERAAAADVSIGLDVAARRRAAEERAALRKEKLRAKKLAAQGKRKARFESIREKQKKPKKRASTSPRTRGDEPGTASVEKDELLAAGFSRERSTRPSARPSDPAARRSSKAFAATIRRRNSIRVLWFLLAFAVATGALVFALLRY
jgi:hypothetical protein